MLAFSGEDPLEDKIANLECTGTDMAAVVLAQSLLVVGRADRGLAPGLREEGQVSVT